MKFEITFSKTATQLLGGVHMKSLSKWYLSTIFLVLFLGNAVAQSAADQGNGAKDAGTCATAALFTSTMPPANRQRVLISGTNLSAKSKSDVESRGKDAAGNESKILPAVEINDCTAFQCTARIDHGPDYEKSFVRIKCENGTFSDWLEVYK
jgi:hypothetical protein